MSISPIDTMIIDAMTNEPQCYNTHPTIYPSSPPFSSYTVVAIAYRCLLGTDDVSPARWTGDPTRPG